MRREVREAKRRVRVREGVQGFMGGENTTVWIFKAAT